VFRIFLLIPLIASVPAGAEAFHPPMLSAPALEELGGEPALDETPPAEEATVDEDSIDARPVPSQPAVPASPVKSKPQEDEADEDFADVKEAPDPDEMSYAERMRIYESPRRFAIDIHYGHFHFPAFDFDGAGTFSSTKGHLVHATFEWLPIVTLGKLGFGVQFDYFVFPDAEVSAGRRVSMDMAVAGVHATYHLDFFFHQILVPYVRVGGSYAYISQGVGNGTIPVPAKRQVNVLDVAGGLKFALFWLDRRGAVQLDSSHGVNDIYFVVEYAKWTNLQSGTSPNLGQDALRFGLRFEF